jgi:hypothetical protein
MTANAFVKFVGGVVSGIRPRPDAMDITDAMRQVEGETEATATRDRIHPTPSLWTASILIIFLSCNGCKLIIKKNKCLTLLKE